MEMHPLQERIGNPQIKVERIKDQINTSRMIVQPLPAGYGTTLGNAIRRVLLSSLSGAAIVAIKMKGASHEYTTIKGLRESLVDIILNLKEVRFEKPADGDVMLKIEVNNKAGAITAKDIKEMAGIKVINKDAYIATIDDKKTSFEMELLVRTGVGYSPASEREKLEPGMISIDAIFTPLRNVAYEVEMARVGEYTDLDKLVLDATTDGTIDSHEAIKRAADILKFYFGLFNRATDMAINQLIDETETDPTKQPQDQVDEEEITTPIEILALSPRTLNALINGGITSVEQLKKTPKKHLSALKGFGKKAMDEVTAALVATEEDLSK
ncbi:MAG: DNA-directed RNA polymerase subunit alpha [Patescibacteria group bacterium]|nr:DNA-directed RNA polymerase subunit alpha [Patescibacteria group bacterium]